MTRSVGPRVLIVLSCAACPAEMTLDGVSTCTAPTTAGRALPADLETPGWCPTRRWAIAEAAGEACR